MLVSKMRMHTASICFKLLEFECHSVHVNNRCFIFHSDDVVIKCENEKTSFLKLARQLNLGIGSRFLQGCHLQSSRSCKGRCGKWQRNEPLKCHCDNLCQELGDCCYDYYSRYGKLTFWHRNHLQQATIRFSAKRRKWTIETSYIVRVNQTLVMKWNEMKLAACLQYGKSFPFGNRQRRSCNF